MLDHCNAVPFVLLSLYVLCNFRLFCFAIVFSHCADYWINPDTQLPSKEEYLKGNNININTINTLIINLTGIVSIVKYLTLYSYYI